MDLAGWEQRYRTQAEPSDGSAHPLVVEAASSLPAGRALDLACGTGRNALWLAKHNWTVIAVDGSPAALEILRRSATGLAIETQIADLKDPSFLIEQASYNLIAMCYYFQRNLIERCKAGLVPGGVMVAIALLIEPGKDRSAFRLQPGELRACFDHWELLHYRECTDIWEHHVAELVARRPTGV